MSGASTLENPTNHLYWARTTDEMHTAGHILIKNIIIELLWEQEAVFVNIVLQSVYLTVLRSR